MAEKEVRKTTRKRTVRKTVAPKASPAVSLRSGAQSGRKAPANTQAQERGGSMKGKRFLISLVLFLILLGVSAAIGYSDKGELNVEQTITLRKQNATPEEQKTLQDVPTQQSQPQAPNGGLVGSGQSDTPPPPPTPAVVASSTASTTAQATSTHAQATSSSADITNSTSSTPAS